MRKSSLTVLGFALFGVSAAHAAPQVALSFPLKRTAYQTNERIDLTAIRSDSAALAADNLVVGLTDDTGRRTTYQFPVAAIALMGSTAASAEQIHIDARLLRPGHYIVDASVDGATAGAEFDVFSHVRYTDYNLIYWTGAQGKQAADLGRDGAGFTMLYGASNAQQEPYIRAGLNFMSVCTMGGAHQMDMRLEDDWSDPYVVRSGTWRVLREAMKDRSYGNIVGVHFYDEPGLASWYPMPSQIKAWKGSRDTDLITEKTFVPGDPASEEAWRQYTLWKESFMDAAWKHAYWGMSQVRPDWIGATQSQYGWGAFNDGYYFNVARSLPVISGHGGYDDGLLATYYPISFLQMARARDMDKPNWYAPTWFGNISGESLRTEENMTFAEGIQGLIVSPNTPYESPNPTRPDAIKAVVECNREMARLGPIFATMPHQRHQLALLYSISSTIKRFEDAKLKDHGYAHQDTQTGLALVASKLAKTPLDVVVEEDIQDGTMARNYKAIVLTGIVTLPNSVIHGLENFVAHGGMVLTTSDCKVTIKGATPLGVAPRDIWYDLVTLHKDELSTGTVVKDARPLAAALLPHLKEAGILPVFHADDDQVIGTRQAYGDIDYLFAINATFDEKNGGTSSKVDLFGPGGRNRIAAVDTDISFPDDGRPVYDALNSGPVKELKQHDGQWKGHFAFESGGMRVFARTARPIGSVRVLQPLIDNSYTRLDSPQVLKIEASLQDANGTILSGSAPMRLEVVDPAGKDRYDLYRATDRGILRSALQFGVNEPDGVYTVRVTDLLAGKIGTATFPWHNPGATGAVVGLEHRASTLEGESDHIYRFMRKFHEVTIARGTSDYSAAAADRLVAILKPWDIQCNIVDAAAINHGRSLTEEEAKTWPGLNGPDRMKAGPGRPDETGFDVRGPVIVVGNETDNPLITWMQLYQFLPYASQNGVFPGPGRGMVAWQIGAIGPEQESVTLIAHDAAGMSEAVGTVYDDAIGMDPLTPWVQPTITDAPLPPAH